MATNFKLFVTHPKGNSSHELMSAFGHKRTLAQCLIWDEFKSLVKCNSISVADIRFAKAVDKIDCDIVSPSAAQSSGFCSNFTSI